ncbi:amidohydrolase family protein [Kocuria palustris]|uniref:amidohydrolase family protein n=1 Tax=Kocuria palustris TaxID=71999 RepID=UPI0021A50B29|nr:amidohydrolase family protein [Kocuria palustris]MCT1591187.1 amidohydrolase family protein [Kocuria palustris]
MDAHFSRRRFVQGSAAAAAAALFEPGTLAPPTHATAGGMGGAGTAISTATNITLSTHPGSDVTVIDVGNVLWRLPVGGGQAHRLTDDVEDATWPSLTPDGRTIVFQSFRHGTYDLCALDLRTDTVSRLTAGTEDDQDPHVSPSGKDIVFISDAGGTSTVCRISVRGGDRHVLIGGDDDRAYHSPRWHPDGTHVVYVADDTRIERLHIKTGNTETLRTVEEGHTVRGLSYSPSGKLIYVVSNSPQAWLEHDGQRLSVSEDEEPAPLPAAWLSDTEFMYATSGEIRRRTLDGSQTSAVPFTVALSAAATPAAIAPRLDLEAHGPALGLTGAALSPDGTQVCFRALNALWISDRAGETRAITNDGYFNADPAWEPDGAAIIYTSDRKGIVNLWRHDLADGTDTQLTFEKDGALLPSVSPDGTSVVFHDEAGGTHRLELASGTVTELLTGHETPGKATWSSDSTKIAMAVHQPASARSDSGLNQVLVLDLVSGETFTQPFAQDLSIATRNHDGPVWAADGTAFYAACESRLHRVPIDSSGRITGEADIASDAIADGVTSSASGEVAFLSLGTFCLLSTPSEVRPSLDYSRQNRPERFTLRAGRLWNGVDGDYQHNVDLTIADGTITDIRPADEAQAADVDASSYTLMPGLIDMHNHWHMRGRAWGNRQGRLWLAYGVTTSRSAGDLAYEARETREAVHAGAGIGPRFLNNGEPLDGNRCSFGFMRCVTSAEQVDREIERILALGYSCVKSYQRLPVALERRLVDGLAAHGIPVISHYVYPAVASGLHGMEHTGGGNRLGYSRTLSAAEGLTAADTVSLLSGGDFWVSSTLLFAAEVHADSRDLVDDERTRVLYPWWDYQRLQDKAEQAATDPDPINLAWTRGDVDLLRSVNEAGGLVVLGTDAPLDDLGVSIHTNLRALVRHGFTPVDALRTGTVNAAKALGASELLGQLTVGAHADMLIVDGDPLTDIADTARIRDVFVDGHRHGISDLLDPYRDSSDTTGSVALTMTAHTCCRRRK